MFEFKFGSDTDGVSSVISVVLMVAIVVILAAVISVFVFGFGEQVDDSSPTASFDFDYDESTGDLTVTKSGGDALSADQLRFSGAALEKRTFGSISEWSGEVETGTPATVNVEQGELLQIVWQDDEGEDTAILGEFQVPDTGGATGSVSLSSPQSVTDEVDVSVGSLARTSGSAFLEIETAAGDSMDASVSAGYTDTPSLTIDPDGEVTATLYESRNKVNQLDSATVSPTLEATIGSVDTWDDPRTPKGDETVVRDIKYNNTDGDSVFVVLVDDPNEGDSQNDAADVTATLSTYGGDVTFAAGEIQGYAISSSETLEIRIYESQSDYNDGDAPITTVSDP